MPLDNTITCRYCGKVIHFTKGFAATWVHSITKSIWCDLSATVRARP